MSRFNDTRGGDRVVPFPVRRTAPPRVVELDGGVFLHAPIGLLRARMRQHSGTHSGRNAIQQAFLVTAEYLLSELEQNSGSTLLRHGMHRRKALSRALELVDMARELAALDAPGVVAE